MLEFLEKFKKLPPEIKQKVSSEEATLIIDEIEEKYEVDLATFVIRVVVGDIFFNNLAAKLIEEFSLDASKARELESELKSRVFNGMIDFLQKGPSSNVSSIIAEDKKTDTGDSPSKKIDLSHLYKKTEQKLNNNSALSENKESKKIDLSHLSPVKKPVSSVGSLLNVNKSSNDKAENKTLVSDIVKDKKEKPQPEKNVIPVIQKEVRTLGNIEEKKTEEVSKPEKRIVPVIKEKESAPKKIEDEDKREIQKIKEESKDIKKNEIAANEINAAIEKIIKDAGISFSSSELLNRFRQIISTYTRGVRSRIDTREALIKNTMVGGVALSQELADKTLKMADLIDYKNQANTEKVNIRTHQEGTAFTFDDNGIRANNGASSKPKIDTRDVDYDLASVLKKTGKISEDKPVVSKVPLEKKKDESVELSKKEEKKQAKEPKQEFKKGAVLGEGKEADNSKIENKGIRTVGDSSRRMDDIKPIPKTMGPVDELRYMDLSVFRRLGTDAGSRVDKIREKINLLSKEGIEKRLEAINAWRQSQINKLYLTIGKQSISLGRGVDEIISLMKNENKDVLEKDEFESIMDFNDELRF